MKLVTRLIAALILVTACLMAALAAGMVLFALYVVAGVALAGAWAMASIYCAWELARLCLQVD